jgi:hypothetical protein
MQRVVADANVLVSAAIARSPQAPSVLTLRNPVLHSLNNLGLGLRRNRRDRKR